MSKLVTIEISQEAADCLAFWAKSEFYGPTISEAIIAQQESWLCREYSSGIMEQPSVEESTKGECDSLEAEFKK